MSVDARSRQASEKTLIGEVVEDAKLAPGDAITAALVSNGNPGVHNIAQSDAEPRLPGVQPLPASYYDAFLSDVAKERKPSPIRSLFPLEHTPGLISLLAGKPNASTFPFTSLSFSARDPITAAETQYNLTQAQLAEALQYGATSGLAQLCDWVVGLQARQHGRHRGEGWRVSIGAGSQDLIYKAVNAMVNPGDAILVESPVYAGVIPIFQTLHCEQIEVATDAAGIRSDSLRATLAAWPAGKRKPKVLYTVPYGCNPTGMTATVERRREVLALAKEHDFIILEDDPYYYLYYGEAARPPSYFALELEEENVGRVLRFESLSKILSAGLRIGFVSGPARLLDAMDQHTATLNLQVSTFTQVVTFSLLDSWGYDGFLTHTRAVSAFYKEKRDVFERALRKYLTGLAEWSTPEAGMFVWFKLLLGPDGDSASLIRTKAVERGVLALPGTVFLPNGRTTAYVRAAFSLAGEADVDEAVKRLRDVVVAAQAELA